MSALGQPGHSSKRKLVIRQSLSCIMDLHEVNRSSFSSPHVVLMAARLTCHGRKRRRRRQRVRRRRVRNQHPFHCYEFKHFTAYIPLILSTTYHLRGLDDLKNQVPK